jgi:hypothetical protein
MIHPDYQYMPQLIPTMASLVESGLYPGMLASHILGDGALRGGMPVWKYVANRFPYSGREPLLGAKLSEYQAGYQAFPAIYSSVCRPKHSDDFVFRQPSPGTGALAGLSHW